jgi:oxygen-independent coproporphyrinogen III oxidase
MKVSDIALERSLISMMEHSSMRRARQGFGGSHTVVTYPPLDVLSRLEHDEPFSLKPPSGGLNVYLHIAFCEWICSFCHYTKTMHRPGHAAPEMNDYMSALADEAAMRAGPLADADIRTVYVGGGTPTALDLDHFETLLGLVAKIARGRAREICVETSPLTMTADDGCDKLAMMAQHGVNRISIGVQTFDEALLPGLRGHDRSTVIRALEALTTSGIALNIDLMQDLPGQTRQSVEQDLDWIARFRPRQVTWYILRFHDGSIMGRPNRGAADVELNDTRESAMCRDLIIHSLTKQGYRIQPGCRFTLDGQRDIHKTVRGGVDAHLLGLGVSAYSHGWGWFFRNDTSRNVRAAIRDYIARIRAGRPATGWCSPISPSERFAGRLCEAARRDVPASMLLGGANECADEARCTIERLVDAGLMTHNEQGWSLSRLGRLFEEEIASLFFSRATREHLREVSTYWADDSWFAKRPEYTDRDSTALGAAIYRAANMHGN